MMLRCSNQEHGMSFHLYNSTFVFFKKTFSFPHIGFKNFILGIFLSGFGVVILNEIFFLSLYISVENLYI